MRVRKKVWRTPGTVYLDNLLIDKDVYLYAGSELFVEPLESESVLGGLWGILTIISTCQSWSYLDKA